MDKARIVVEGRERLLADPESRKRIEQAVQEIRAQYEREARGLGKIARARRWLRMQRELRMAVERIAPSRGCYFRR